LPTLVQAHLVHHILELATEFFGMLELLPRLLEERVHLSALATRHLVQ
jgi:hypothetical protein